MLPNLDAKMNDFYELAAFYRNFLTQIQNLSKNLEPITFFMANIVVLYTFCLKLIFFSNII